MIRTTLLTAVLLTATAASAHDGPRAELASIDAALEARPDDVDLLLRRAAIHRRARDRSGLVHAEAGDVAKAEADLTSFLGGAPSAAGFAARARVREAAGRIDEARADYDAAVKLRPEPDTYLARGHLDEVKGALDRAAAGYEEGLAALGGAVSLRLALVRVETARGRHDRVIALADEAMAGAERKADWLLIRADAHAAAKRAPAALRDRTAALRELDEALARRPNDLTRVSRARALLALGRGAEATRELEGVVARSPGLDAARSLLVDAQRRARRSP